MTLEQAKDKIANIRIHGMQSNCNYKGFYEWRQYLHPSTSALISCLEEAAELYAQSLQADAWELGRETTRAYNKAVHAWIEGMAEEPHEPANPYKPKG